MAGIGHSVLLKYFIDTSKMSDIQSNVPKSQELRDSATASSVDDQIEVKEEFTYSPVITVTKEETTLTKGELKLQKVVVSEDISDETSNTTVNKTISVTEANSPNIVQTVVHSEVNISVKPDQASYTVSKSEKDNETGENENKKSRKTRIPMFKLKEVAERVKRDEESSIEKAVHEPISDMKRRSSIPRLKDTKKQNTQKDTNTNGQQQKPDSPKIDDEFDKIYEKISTPEKLTEAEIVDSIFEEIIHAYDENEDANTEKVKSKIPLLKRKSEHEIVIPPRYRKSSLKKSYSTDDSKIKVQSKSVAKTDSASTRVKSSVQSGSYSLESKSESMSTTHFQTFETNSVEILKTENSIETMELSEKSTKEENKNNTITSQEITKGKIPVKSGKDKSEKINSVNVSRLPMRQSVSGIQKVTSSSSKSFTKTDVESVNKQTFSETANKISIVQNISNENSSSNSENVRSPVTDKTISSTNHNLSTSQVQRSATREETKDILSENINIVRTSSRTENVSRQVSSTTITEHNFNATQSGSLTLMGTTSIIRGPIETTSINKETQVANKKTSLSNIKAIEAQSVSKQNSAVQNINTEITDNIESANLLQVSSTNIGLKNDTTTTIKETVKVGTLQFDSDTEKSGTKGESTTTPNLEIKVKELTRSSISNDKPSKNIIKKNELTEKYKRQISGSNGNVIENETVVTKRDYSNLKKVKNEDRSTTVTDDIFQHKTTDKTERHSNETNASVDNKSDINTLKESSVNTDEKVHVFENKNTSQFTATQRTETNASVNNKTDINPLKESTINTAIDKQKENKNTTQVMASQRTETNASVNKKTDINTLQESRVDVAEKVHVFENKNTAQTTATQRIESNAIVNKKADINTLKESSVDVDEKVHAFENKNSTQVMATQRIESNASVNKKADINTLKESSVDVDEKVHALENKNNTQVMATQRTETNAGVNKKTDINTLKESRVDTDEKVHAFENKNTTQVMATQRTETNASVNKKADINTLKESSVDTDEKVHVFENKNTTQVMATQRTETNAGVNKKSDVSILKESIVNTAVDNQKEVYAFDNKNTTQDMAMQRVISSEYMQENKQLNNDKTKEETDNKATQDKTVEVETKRNITSQIKNLEELDEEDIIILKGKVSRVISRLDSREFKINKTDDDIPKNISVVSKIAIFEKSELDDSKNSNEDFKPKIVNELLKTDNQNIRADDFGNSTNKVDKEVKSDYYSLYNTVHASVVNRLHSIEKRAKMNKEASAGREDTWEKKEEETRNVIKVEIKRTDSEVFIRRDTKEFNVNREGDRRSKSVAEVDLGDVLKGRVRQMVSRMNSIEQINLERRAFDRKERARGSVLSRAALFERKVVPVYSDENVTRSIEKETAKPSLSDEEILERIAELSNAKVKYGKWGEMSTMELRDGTTMPVLAVGTALLEPKLIKPIISTAIDLGYRAIDTAFIYGNEKLVGEAIQAKIQDGSVRREELFIISKLWSTFHRRDLVETACRASLKAMGLEYFDLYMIHNPMSFREGPNPIPKIANVLQYSEHDYLEAWYGIESVIRQGLARKGGVSNFNSLQVDRVVEKGKIKPVLNQVECHPYLTQFNLSEFCAIRNVKLSCFSVLGSKGTPAELKSGIESVIDDPLVKVMAAGLGVTPAQLLIAYQLHLGRHVVVKSSSGAHLWENLQALNVTLDQSQISALNALNKNKRNFIFKGMGDTHRNYPFKIAF